MISVNKFVIFVLSVGLSASQKCQKWKAVSEEDYSQTFVSSDDPNANDVKPLGYQASYYQFEGEQPCFEVEFVPGSGRKIEIKFELPQSRTLMLKNDKDENIISSGGQPTLTSCLALPETSPITYTFFCTGTGCEGIQTYFWFRFVVETPDEDGKFDENWCSNRNSEFPSSLIKIITGLTPPPETTTTSTASTTHSIFNIILITVINFIFFT